MVLAQLLGMLGVLSGFCGLARTHIMLLQRALLLVQDEITSVPNTFSNVPGATEGPQMVVGATMSVHRSQLFHFMLVYHRGCHSIVLCSTCG